MSALFSGLTPPAPIDPQGQSANLTTRSAAGASSLLAYPRFQALTPARDVALGQYLPLGGDFSSATADLNIVKGLEVKLPGRDGAAILLSFRERSWAPGASVVRYDLTAVADAGG